MDLIISLKLETLAWWPRIISAWIAYLTRLFHPQASQRTRAELILPRGSAQQSYMIQIDPFIYYFS